MVERAAIAAAALVLAAPLLVASTSAADGPKLGQSISEADLEAWDIGIGADGKGLPPGWGTVAEGEKVFAATCRACHGEKGEGKPNDPLVGGIGTIAGNGPPLKTVGSFWPHATTLFDYVRRAMPWNAPKSLTNSEVYAVTAYVLHLNGILPADASLDHKSLPKVLMPNRDGFEPFVPRKVNR